MHVSYVSDCRVSLKPFPDMNYKLYSKLATMQLNKTLCSILCHLSGSSIIPFGRIFNVCEQERELEKI